MPEGHVRKRTNHGKELLSVGSMRFDIRLRVMPCGFVRLTQFFGHVSLAALPFYLSFFGR